VELPSEMESYRQVLKFRTPTGEAASVIVMRRHRDVWLTFNGAEKPTVVMKEPEAGQLDALRSGHHPLTAAFSASARSVCSQGRSRSVRPK
jgi:hypothetical protein